MTIIIIIGGTNYVILVFFQTVTNIVWLHIIAKIFTNMDYYGIPS